MSREIITGDFHAGIRISGNKLEVTSTTRSRDVCITGNSEVSTSIDDFRANGKCRTSELHCTTHPPREPVDDRERNNDRDHISQSESVSFKNPELMPVDLHCIAF